MMLSPAIAPSRTRVIFCTGSTGRSDVDRMAAPIARAMNSRLRNQMSFSSANKVIRTRS